MNVDQLRRKKTGLRNDSLDAEARPGHEAVVIKKQTLAYYLSLEGMLDDALDLASQNHPPIIQISAKDIQAGMEDAAAGVIAKLAGIAAPSPVAPALPAGQENGAGWMSVQQLIDAHSPKVSAPTVYQAINDGKIQSRGQGRARKVSEVDYVAWLSTRKNRGG